MRPKAALSGAGGAGGTLKVLCAALYPKPRMQARWMPRSCKLYFNNREGPPGWAEHPLRTGGSEIKLNGEQMERNSSGALRAPGAFGARDTSSCDSLELLAPHHARLLACSEGRSTADDAASGRRAGASGAAATFLSMRVCRDSVAVLR